MCQRTCRSPRRSGLHPELGTLQNVAITSRFLDQLGQIRGYLLKRQTHATQEKKKKENILNFLSAFGLIVKLFNATE